MNIFNKYTLKTLSKNKSRTLVTIIGIILSASMITAVISLVTSLQSFLLKTAISNHGDWHGAVYDISLEELAKLQGNADISRYGTLQNIGYSLLEEGVNDEKPYLAILGIGESFKDMMPINLISGRMPKNNTEIILPDHLKNNGGVKYQLEDVLELSIGERLSDGMKLYQNTQYQSGKYGTEELVATGSRTYHVVGFYERPSFESYSAPGYSALTLTDETASNSYLAYIKLNTPKNIYDFINKTFPGHDSINNYSVLRYIGASDETSLNAVLYGLSSILIAIIMLASISLIYNAFSISISERIKQFGLLSSVGATKRQLMKSVMFEASFLSSIGIPLGIIAGLSGIGVTLTFTKDLFTDYIGKSNDPTITLSLKITVLSLVITVFIAFITILISAYIPARKAVKISNIEAIRQTHDINIRSRSVKTSKLTYKVFGFEGMIASKNFKRNRKKYRATVISLFVSVVLFITASSFCAYLKKSVFTIVNSYSYDIMYYYESDQNKKESISDIYNLISSTNGVTKSSYIFNNFKELRLKSESLSKEYFDYYNKVYGEDFYKTNDNEYDINATISFINDNEYAQYLKDNGFDVDKYMDMNNPVGIALDFIKEYRDDGRYYTYRMLNNTEQTIHSMNTKEIEGYYISDRYTNEEGETVYVYQKDESNEYETEIQGEDIQIETEQPSDSNMLEFPEQEVVDFTELTIGATTDIIPFGLDSYAGNFVIMYPYSAVSSVLGEDYEINFATLYFKTIDHKLVYDSMYKQLDERGFSALRLYDIASNNDTDRAMLIIVNVFSYGFITLISLIAAANVFNTISTNINLRRREFAILKSIGMTQKGFHKMMNYECMLYGLKGLLFGIPVSIVITYFIYRSILNGWETTFFIPAHSIIIAISSVFIVVFSTMLYSMSRIKKENTIDALKNENL